MPLKIENKDCMELMAEYPDKHFDFAIVDPPYGTGKTWNKDTLSPLYKHKSTYKNDSVPGAGYWAELFRVSKRQFIWGANYCKRYLPDDGSWIVWDKMRTDGIRSNFELAWTSIKKSHKIARFMWDGFKTCCKRIGKHPHEKPVALYAWILQNYAKPDWNILDTHLGSGTLAIACLNAGLDLTASEIDAGYYAGAMGLIKEHTAQKQLFNQREVTVFKSLFEEPET